KFLMPFFGVGMLISSALAQTAFQNLDFELGSLPGTFTDVPFNVALPGWIGTFANPSGSYNVSTVVFNNQPISSGGVCVFDASYPGYGFPSPEVITQVLHGRYSVFLQSGSNYPDYGLVSTSLSQVGYIPASAKSVTFRTSTAGLGLVVTFDGNPIPLRGIGDLVYGDVIDFAGRTGELSFTAPYEWGPSPVRSLVLLDYIRFSALPAFPPPVISVPPASQTAETGSSVCFAVEAEGDRLLGHQWFFNATNRLAGSSTNSSLILANVQPPQAGAYTVVVSNLAGAITSAPALLGVIPPVERRLAPGINLTDPPGSVLYLEYAADVIPGPRWLPLATVPLTNTSQFYFDATAPLPPQRFYRAWPSGGSNSPPALSLYQVPALTLPGAVGSKVRVDTINKFGPVSAWVTLDTVLLTTTSQLYFDVSAISQPPRLWRIVPVP
ncbi:MAG: immunoglobulin domain-containing protein, partial [Verrucomicrobia bacterium]|nr:immunoglobulin domain-containing protein [Verrucomicrobiota bacterium]